MTFSIIVPVYNVEDYIRECIESVIGQTFRDFELLLVDDGSTDNSGKICESYSDRYSFIKTWHKENGGLSDARNFGLRQASGTYVIFLDSDDYWNGSKALENMFVRIQESRCDILIFNRCKLYENGEMCIEKTYALRDCIVFKTKEAALEHMIKVNAWKPSACNKAVRMALLKDNNLEFEKGKLHEDLLWCCKAMLYAERYDYYEAPVYVYRQRKSSISRTIGQQNILDINSQLNECIRLAGNYPERMKEIIYSYCAYDYSILLGFTGMLEHADQKKYYGILRDKAWLLNYHLSDKVKKVDFLYKAAGYRWTCCLLTLFLKYKK